MTIETPYFWLRLFETRGIGPKKLIKVAQILEQEKIEPKDIPLKESELTEEFPALAKILKGKIRQEDREKVYKLYQELQEGGIEILYPFHDKYPQKILHFCENFNISPVLFTFGKQSLLNAEGLAIVGSRNVPKEGIEATQEIAAQLANHGYNVVSGYAKGVDTEAHLGALSAEGTTTMGLSYGIQKLRSKQEFKEFNWQRDILAVSQFSPQSKWTARNAMARNKLVCALSSGVIVITSGEERDSNGKMSGTFDAAKTALKMGLPLFVVTPQYYKDSPQGNIDLIQKGGIEFNPNDGIGEILKHFSQDNAEQETVSSLSQQPQQLSLPLA